MILRCTTPTCVNLFQDNRYGLGYRVANPRKKYPELARCTVCKVDIRIHGTVQTAAVVTDRKEKKKNKK